MCAKTMDGEQWVTPSDCDSYEDHAVAALIGAVLGYSGGASSSQPAIDDQLADWVRALNEYLDEVGNGARWGKTDAEIAKINERFYAATEAIWARPCTTWSDVVLRAAIALHWNSSPLPDDPAYHDDVIAGDPDIDFDARALAYLVRGILDMAGLAFDSEGRLLNCSAA
jgi:hypothetical protein